MHAARRRPYFRIRVRGQASRGGPICREIFTGRLWQRFSRSSPRSFVARPAGRRSVDGPVGRSVATRAQLPSLPPSLPHSRQRCHCSVLPSFRPSASNSAVHRRPSPVRPLSLSGANTHPLWPSSRPTERCAEEEEEEDMRTTDRGPPRSGRARLARADRRRAGGGSRTWTDRSRRYDILGMKVDQPSPSLSLSSFPSFPAL